MEIQLSMLILEVRDLATSVAFYRDLGLDLPDPVSGRPVVIHRMGSGVSLLLTTSFAATYDPAWTRPTGGYQQLLEFYVGENAVVDHYKVQEESSEAFHVASMHVNAGRSANFSSHSFSLGGKLVRNDANALLGESGAYNPTNGVLTRDAGASPGPSAEGNP